MPPLATTDFRPWCVKNAPEDNTATSGGVIDDTGTSSVPGVEPVFTQMAAADSVQIVSDGADTRTVAVTCRKADGTIVAQTGTLNGATAVTLSTMGSVLYVLKAIASAVDAARTITVRRLTGPVTIRTIEPTRRGFRLMFYDTTSDESVTKTYYEGFYWVNHNASLALTHAQVTLTVDGANAASALADISQGIAAAKGDVSTITNRVTTPGGITFVTDGTVQDVPTTNLANGERIFVWQRLALSATCPAINASFTSKISGSGF